MNVFAIDTSSRAASCAWAEDGTVVGEYYINADLTHSATLMPMVQSMLRCCGRRLEEADVFAVTCGPGSFTGLRIGIAALKGMAMTLDKPCAAISTLEVLAAGLSPFRGHILPVMDARRGQFYTALFHSDGAEIRRVNEDQTLTAGQLWDIVQPLDQVILVGDGALLCRQEMEGRGRLFPVAPPGLLHQRAGTVALCAGRAAGENALIHARDLVPFYLRLPQAERERLEREQHKEENKL